MRILRSVVARAQARWEPIIGLFGLAQGWLRRRPDYIVERWPGEVTMTGATRIAIFTHYDQRGRVADYVHYYLDALVAAGFRIVFVTNSPQFGQENLPILKTKCALILRRRNIGHDFGAYRDGLSMLPDLGTLEQLLFANDSVYGPLFDLDTVLSRCNDRAAIWGITDSWERRFHLQSYFLLVGKKALSNPEFAAFWRNARYLQSRIWVIRRHEIGFTQKMSQAGLRCMALFPYRAAAAKVSAVAAYGRLQDLDLSDQHHQFLDRLLAAVERGWPLNGTHFFWDYLIGEAGCPFLKRDLLRRNPMRVPFVNQWQRLIERNSRYDTDLIVRDLEDGLRNRTT